MGLQRKKTFRLKDIILFRQVSPEPGQSIESFATRLRKRAKSCAFGNVDEAVRDKIVENCSSSKLRRRLVREADHTLTNCLQIAKLLQALSPPQRFPCFSVNSFSFPCFSVIFCMNSDDYVCVRKRN